MFNLLNSSVNKERRELQIKELEKEIDSRIARFKDYSKGLKETMYIEQLFKIKVFNSQKSMQYDRFDGETSSWSFGVDKIDAIQFTVKESQRLVGYVHFGIVDWGSNAELRLQARVFQGETKLAEQTFVLVRTTVEQRNFELKFDNPVDLEPDLRYDLVQQNVGPNFQGRHGSSCKEISGPFQFFKSSKDNNGTSQTSGQFKAMLVLSHI